MDISTDHQTASAQHYALFNDQCHKQMLSSDDSAALMRAMFTSLDLNNNLRHFFECLQCKLPCTSIKLSFADQAVKVGRASRQSRIMKISLYYGRETSNQQQAQLAYAFSSVLTPIQRKLLSEMHNILAMSLSHALELYRISQLASKDILTGLSNRSEFSETLARMLSQSRRNQKTFGLLVLDLDNFKAVNDKHGHSEGDSVLVAFADVLRTCLRDTDYAFRFGGDEFCCVLSECCAQANEYVAKRISLAVAQHPLLSRHGVSTSIGATRALPKDNQNKLFERADKALYEAKQAGKNLFKAAV